MSKNYYLNEDAHEIQKLESTIKLLYLLRDLNISTADQLLAVRWQYYMTVISALTVEGQ